MPCYSLYLTSQTMTGVAPSNEINIKSYNRGPALASTTVDTRPLATWTIDFDSLFGKAADEYKYCRVMVKVKCANNLIDASFYSRNMAVLSASLATNYTGTGSSFLPSLLGIGAGVNSPIGGTRLDININTLLHGGINIETPRGVQDFTLAFQNPQQFTALLLRTATFTNNFHLIFELY
jgi:hypothetical protein